MFQHILQLKVPGVAQQVHPLRVELGEEVGGRRVLHGDAHAVQRGHPLLLTALHLQSSVFKTPHGIHPGLLLMRWLVIYRQ